jgi:hypothetical protein
LKNKPKFPKKKKRTFFCRKKTNFAGKNTCLWHCKTWRKYYNNKYGSAQLNLVVSNKRKKEKKIRPRKGQRKKNKKDPPPKKNSSFLCFWVWTERWEELGRRCSNLLAIVKGL